MSKFSGKNISCMILIIFLHFSLSPLIPSSGYLIAADDDDLTAKLNKAEESYYDGDLDTALALVLECLRETALSQKDRLRANIILAHILLTKDDTEAAKKALIRVLEMDAEYKPTIEEEAPRYVALVEDARKEILLRKVTETPSESGISNWVWIGAGGAAVAVAAVLLLSGNEGGSNPTSSRLPSPPALP